MHGGEDTVRLTSHPVHEASSGGTHILCFWFTPIYEDTWRKTAGNWSHYYSPSRRPKTTLLDPLNLGSRDLVSHNHIGGQGVYTRQSHPHGV